ncbi:diguanylate cyclase (GGDEF)-like protein [Halomonas organivorans]|uniref:diguanylate cyclase n=2 Tax=Halomonas organivorans TaxID=257772 RepID=A0A7W5BXW5_9GAMM|nr:diguanylate cyclase (GGDEF)-like protein [Halomonas organivorans]
MNMREQALLDEVLALLDDPSHRDHPLHGALERLYRHHLEQRERLERLISIADGFQQSAQYDLHDARHQLEHQRRRQRKLSRIADRFQELLHERNQALEDVSGQDPLTGLANRRRLHQHLEEMTDDASQPFSVAMIDIDHFKVINDRYGHAAGDRALIALAKTLTASLRAGDLCGRWGGEEFLLALPTTRLDQAECLVARLGDRLRQLDLALDASGEPTTVTASIGIAEHQPDEDYRDTIHRADQALLTAKREGRDRSRRAG